MPQQGPYDVVPPGKKPWLDPKTGDWKLVDLDSDSIEDLQTQLDDLKAKHVKVASENEELKAQNKLLKEENKELREIARSAPKKK